MTVRQREDAGGLVKGTAHVNTSASNYGHILNGHTLTCKYLRIGVDSTPVWASGRGTYGSREAELTPSPPPPTGTSPIYLACRVFCPSPGIENGKN